MRLLIDGDALPRLLKPILLRAIRRLEISAKVISNKRISLGEKDLLVEYQIVGQGADAADHRIVETVEEGDLVVTADIPLADRVVARKAYAIDHRGVLYDEENVKQYLAMRNLMEEIRLGGEMVGGPKPFGPGDAHRFANTLHRFLTERFPGR